MKKTVKKLTAVILAVMIALTYSMPAFALDEQALVSDSASAETLLSDAVAPQGGEYFNVTSSLTIAADSTNPRATIRVDIYNCPPATSYSINWNYSSSAIDPLSVSNKGADSNSLWWEIAVVGKMAGSVTVPITVKNNSTGEIIGTKNCYITVTAPTLTVSPSDIVIDLNKSNSATVNAVISNHTSSQLDIGYAVSSNNISASYGSYITNGTEIIVTGNTPGTYYLYTYIRNPYTGYNIVSQTHRVTVKAVRAVSSISVDTYPTKTTYYVGESFSSSGMVIRANYNDGTSEYITSGFTCSSPDMSTAGKKNVKVTYGGKTTSFYITVNAKPAATLSSISIRTNPSKTTYTVGESFNSSGLSLTAKYSDGSTKTITSGFTCSKPDMSTVGTKTVTVTYQGKTASFNITVKAKAPAVTVSSIEIRTTPSKLTYTVGETFNSSGLTLNVYYSDGTSKSVTSGFTCSSPDMSTAGTKTVTVTYKGKTASFNITVKAKPVTVTLSSISVKTNPSKTTYTVGESFNSSGLSLTAKYSDGSTKVITSGFTCTEPDMTTAGTKSVTVTYQGKTASFDITVKEAIVKADSVKIIVEKDFNNTDVCDLGVEIGPSNAEYSGVLWRSTDTSIATVDQNGVVTTKGVPGETQIIVTVYNYDKTFVMDVITVTVERPENQWTRTEDLFASMFDLFGAIIDLLIYPFVCLIDFFSIFSRI